MLNRLISTIFSKNHISIKSPPERSKNMIIFGVPVITSPPDNRYWVGGSGNWFDDEHHWAITSGGLPGLSNMPDATMDVYFDTNSGMGSDTEVINLNTGDGGLDPECHNIISTTEHTYTIASDVEEILNIYGNVTLEPGVTIDYLDSYIEVYVLGTENHTVNLNGGNILSLHLAGSGTHHFNQNGGLIEYLYVSGTAKVILDADMTIYNADDGDGSLSIGGGSFDANDYNVNAYYITNNSDAVATIKMGSGTWTIIDGWNFAGIYNISIDAETSILKFDNLEEDITFKAGNQNFNTVWFANTGSYIVSISTSTFNTFKVDPGCILRFADGAEITVTNVIATGNISNKITMTKSTGAVNNWKMICASGTVDCDYLILDYSTAEGGATFNAGANSTNGGHNVGWTFTVNGFKTEWAVSGDDTARTITLPLVQSRYEGSLSYNFNVDWGDGSSSVVTAYNDINRIHTYASNGTYVVVITGTMEGWSFNNGGSKLKITKVLDWGNVGFDGFSYLKCGFMGCQNLVSLASGGISKSGLGVQHDGFEQMFFVCLSLASIPVDLFKNHVNVNASAFNMTFGACYSLISVPADLFKYNINVSTLGFLKTFYYCTSLETIPADIFKYAPFNNTFESTFESCTSLTTIPADLFKYNVDIAEDGFYSTFKDCSALTSIPVDLFRYNTGVDGDSFENTFQNCISLVSVPANLFKYNILSLDFINCFKGCDNLQLNANIFYADGEQTTRFLNKNVSFTNCFQRSSFTGIQGIAPDLWNCSFGSGTPVKTGCYGDAGNSLTSISNYNDITSDWK